MVVLSSVLKEQLHDKRETPLLGKGDTASDTPRLRLSHSKFTLRSYHDEKYQLETLNLRREKIEIQLQENI